MAWRRGASGGAAFAVAAFTQLTQDHLDLHGTMQRYFEAKRQLFQQHLRPGGAAVIHLDGPWGQTMADAVRERDDLRLIRCSRHDRHAEVRLSALKLELSGLSGVLHFGPDEQPFRVPLLGDFNAENVLLAAGCAHALGLSLAQTTAGLGALGGVPGRLERVDDGSEEHAVLVDYAHTPDALARALATLRLLKPRRLLLLFGCGGERDRGKRRLMGEAAARGADLVIVSTDNPRGEAPAAIVEGIVEGLASAGATALTHLARAEGLGPVYWLEPDRARAIAAATALLGPGELLLIAGKGHEDYQLIGDQRLPFDDRQHARLGLAARQQRKTGGASCG
ncbi:MAG: UDP-N-acetylmuramyl-tripeptide synthetase [Proteobacteria bacterium]|nr:UDP-N-acetylmuramyl-tripeptide synthetase [Pseudomonadota bacterium]